MNYIIKFIKNNKVIIGIQLLILFIMIFCFISYFKKYYSYDYDILIDNYNMLLKECQSNSGKVSEKTCSTIEQPLPKKEKLKKESTQYFFLSVLHESFSTIMCILFPLFVFIMVASKLHNKFSSGAIRNYLMRESFRKFKVDMNKIVFRISLLAPIFLIVFYLICCILTNFNFDYMSNPDIVNSSYYDKWIFNNINLYVFIHYIILVIVCIFYGNLAITFMNKNKNIYITTIFSYLCLCCFYTIAGKVDYFIVRSRFKFLSRYFNIFDFYTFYNLEVSLYGFIISAIILVFISIIIKNLILRKKERVIIENEKGII